MKHSYAILFLVLLAGCSRPQEQITTSSEKARQEYVRGFDLYEKFFYGEAIEAFKQSVADDPGFALAWCRLAVVLREFGETGPADSAMARALALSGKVTGSEQMLIRMHFARSKYDFRTAAAVADSLIERYPNLREPYLIRGVLYRSNQNLADAIRMWEKALKIDSSYSLAVMWLGYGHSEQGDAKRGIEYMQRYIRMVPNAADPRASYADILMRVGEYDEAFAQYQKALELQERYWYSYMRMAEIYSLKGRLKAAEKSYAEYASVLPQNARLKGEVLVNEASVADLRGDFTAAEQKLTEALALDSTNGKAAYRLVYLLARQKKFKPAEQVAEGIGRFLAEHNLLGSSDMMNYNLLRASLLEGQGKYAEALIACDSAVQYASPLTMADVFRMTALVHLGNKEYEEALDAAEEALRLAPNHPMLLMTVLKVYSARGDARMTREIGGRLMDFWKDADPDFRLRREVVQILARTRPG
jgi:tetratricopeptide (TPR) repeat protein